MTRVAGARRSGNGPVLAFLIAVAAFLIVLSIETQWIARRSGYSQQLGRPAYRQYYFPWASLDWMLTYDLRLNLVDASLGRPIVSFNAHEAPWARNAFAAERGRLSWEAGSSLALFLVLCLWWPKGRRNSDLYGSARWATNSDLRRSALTRAHRGVILGQTWRSFNRFGTLLIHDGTENVLGLGSPGEGKSNSIARPTLTHGWTGSAIVFDPAYELTRLTAQTRALFSRVLVFDPRSPSTIRFNALAGIAVGDVDSVRAVLASYFYDRDPSEMNSDTRFFESRALALAVAVASHMIEVGTATLEATARYVSDPIWKNEGEICESLLKSEISYVQETGAEFARMTDKQRSPLIASLTDRLEMFRSPAVARATAESDISAAGLRSEATTLFLVVREGDQAALNPLIRMILTRLIHDLIAHEPRRGDQQILLMLDEFPLLKAPIIEQELATIRKHAIRAVLLAQSLSQIRKYYGPSEAISGMCDVRVFFPSLDGATQQLAVDTCGQTTRSAESQNWDHAGKTGHSAHEVARPLLYAHELADLKAKGGIIVYKKGERPIKARPIRAHSDPRFSLKGRDTFGGS